MVTLVNRAKVTTTTTGTGTLTLGSAVDGFQTFAAAGVSDADVVRYVIEDGTDWEIGTGTYTASGTTLSRTVSESSNADAALNLTGSALVYVSAAAEDIPPAIELYAENPVGFYFVSATGTNAVAIGNSALAAGTNGVSFGTSASAGGTNSVAFGTSANASNLNTTAIGQTASATQTYATALGVAAVSAGQYSTAFSTSYASGSFSLAAAIGTSSSSYGATGTNSVAIGQLAKATNTNSIAIGDTALSETANLIALGGTTDTVQISGTYSLPTADGTTGQVLTTNGAGVVTFSDAGGGGTALELYAENPSSPTAPSATGTNAVAIGTNSAATQDFSVSLGRYASSSVVGKISLSSGVLGVLGAAQNGIFVLASDTTTATPEALTTNNSTPSTTNQIILPNNSAYAFHGTIVARQQASAGTACAAWKIEGLIRREGSAGTTVLVNSATTVLDNTPAWGMAISADTTNGGLKIEVTGAAATNIRFVATINTSEVTY